MASKYLDTSAQRSANEMSHMLTSWIRYEVSMFPVLRHLYQPYALCPLLPGVRSHLFKLLKPSLRINIDSIFRVFPLQRIRPSGNFQGSPRVFAMAGRSPTGPTKLGTTYYIKSLLQGLRCLESQRSISYCAETASATAAHRGS